MIGCRTKTKELVKKHSPDDPVSLREEDHLGRWDFAQDISELITNEVAWSSSRIGLYGGWGTGKTSVLGFIRTILESKGYPVISFDPWKFHSIEDLWNSFILTVDAALRGKSKGHFSKAKMQGIANKAFNAADRSIDYVDSKIAKSLYSILKGPAKQLLQTSRDEIEQKISQLCVQGRLVVLIDDLDRTDSALLPEILLNLRSILDLKGLVYVLALDPVVVGSALGRMNEEWSDGYSFLEKIIEYPRWLPQPTTPQWQKLLIHEAQQLKSQVDEVALKNILDLLPKNPRKLKQYLRFLAPLKTKVVRFDEHEINLPILYLAQALRIEFPDTAPKILCDKDLCEYIRFTSFEGRGGWDNEEKAKEKETRRKLKIDEMAPKDQPSRERFHLLIEGLSRHYDLADQNDLEAYFYFVESKIILTWKEYAEFLNQWGQANIETRNQLVSRFLNDEDCFFLFKRTIEYRHNILGQVADAFDEEEEQSEKLKVADLAFELLSCFINDLNLFAGNKPLLGADSFYSLLCHVKRWSNFKGQTHYDERREQEKQLLSKLIENSSNQHVEFLEKYLNERDHFDDEHKDFNKFLEPLIGTLNKSTAQKLLNIFNQPNDFHSLCGEDCNIAIKGQLLVSGSHFHADENQTRLQEIAKRAKSDVGIQKNFCDCFRMVAFYSRNSPVAATMEEVQLVAKKNEFMGMIWTAATTRRLNRRIVGTLSEMRRNIVQLVTTDGHLPLPQWWNDVLLGPETPSAKVDTLEKIVSAQSKNTEGTEEPPQLKLLK